jgi:predicted transcriptional regulator
MDDSFFSKYQKVIKADTDKREEIINLIETHSGIKLLKEEIVINKKTISFHVSSAKKSKLHQSNVRKLMSDLGYSVVY